MISQKTNFWSRRSWGSYHLSMQSWDNGDFKETKPRKDLSNSSWSKITLNDIFSAQKNQKNCTERWKFNFFNFFSMHSHSMQLGNLYYMNWSASLNWKVVILHDHRFCAAAKFVNFDCLSNFWVWRLAQIFPWFSFIKITINWSLHW